jgi:hypothetical protein
MIMSSRSARVGISGKRTRLLAAVVGGGAFVVMGAFTVTHGGIAPSPSHLTSDSGDETKFPPFSSPVVPAMTTAANASMGATTTAVAPQTALPMAVPTLKAPPG